MSFAQKLIAWRRRHGRRGLPWQGTRDPYRIWLSEVMLQQTQVATVIPYYRKFVSKYPTVEALAAASEDEVLRLWSGLGYYARGRNLHKAAQEIRKNGFPKTAAGIAELPGVGRSTAAAIAAFAFGERAAILDGNVKRVLARCFGEERELWTLAERLLPARGIEGYTQGLMDLGATVCTRKPQCDRCPVKARCVARKTGRIAELPAPRPRKVLPRRKTTWHVYLDRGMVLLERRPSSGIWGGLWCFPERALSRTVTTHRLAPIDHGFTHFRLRIQPLLHRAIGRQDIPGGCWIALRQTGRTALPAPAKKLLLQLRLDRTIRQESGGQRPSRAVAIASRASK